MKSTVPLLREEVIEGEAEMLLADYGREHGAVVCPPVPIDEIIELHLKLEFEVWEPNGMYFAIGEEVTVELEASLFNGRITFRTVRQAEEF